MKKVICLGGGGNQIAVIESALRLGLEVITIDQNANAKGRNLSTHFINVSTHKPFEIYDALLLPVTLGSAYKHVEPKYENGMLLNFMEPVKIDGKIIENIAVDTFYTNLFNLMGNPVIVIPIGFTESGLPVGIQVVGRRWSDAKLLIVAKQLFEVAGDFRHPPGFMN